MNNSDTGEMIQTQDDAEAHLLHAELDRQFDAALLRDGDDELITPIWDGVQYVGGVPTARPAPLSPSEGLTAALERTDDPQARSAAA